MNGRIAKALRKFATKTGLPYREAKKKWARTPAPERAIYHEQVKEEINAFGVRLKRWRGARTLKEAAAVLNVPVDTYKGWEYGKHLPSGPALEHIENLTE